MDFDKLLDTIKDTGLDKAKQLGKEGDALVQSARTSTVIVTQAGKRLLSGKIDQVGATAVAMDGIHQLEQLAQASGNLAAAGLVGWLKGVWDVVKQLVPIAL